MNDITLSVVIPCYNEELCLIKTYKRVTSVCQAEVGKSYEIIFVNDGSKDSSWKIMKDLAMSDNNLVCINMGRNFGHQISLSAGLRITRGKLVLILDADLQDPPELLPKMIDKVKNGCDVVYGQRIKREGETITKKLTAFVFYRLLGIVSEISIPKDTGDFRLMTRKAVDILNKMPEHHRFIRGMVSWIGLQQESVPYERAGRISGKTKYTLSKMIYLSIDAITSFSIKPLRIAAVIGLVLGLLSIFLLFFVLLNYIFWHSIQGWTSIMLVVLLMGSIQLIVIGVTVHHPVLHASF